MGGKGRGLGKGWWWWWALAASITLRTGDSYTRLSLFSDPLIRNVSNLESAERAGPPAHLLPLSPWLRTVTGTRHFCWLHPGWFHVCTQEHCCRLVCCVSDCRQVRGAWNLVTAMLGTGSAVKNEVHFMKKLVQGMPINKASQLSRSTVFTCFISLRNHDSFCQDHQG